MTKSLRISPTLTLPLEAVTSTFGLLAVRGAGKSNAGAVMAEEMFAAGLPFVAIDPVGSWPGLRSGADGSPGGGIPIPIFGGRHGDVPLERGAGELVADMIAEQRLSCVLDLSKFPSEGDKKAFLLAFARRIYEKNQDPLHLFLEEADDYIPQKPLRDELQLLRAWENIVRRGRGRGLGMTLITQRSAVVAKNVLTQVETLFVLRTTGPQDIIAIEAWVKYHQVGEDMLKTLAGLEDGEAWVWSPHFLRKMERFRFRQRATFDTGATPKNVRGKDSRKVATLADVDLGALKTKMASTIEKAKADDPKALRAEIARLTKEIAKRPEATAPTVETRWKAIPIDWKSYAAGMRRTIDATMADLNEKLRAGAMNLENEARTHPLAGTEHLLDTSNLSRKEPPVKLPPPQRVTGGIVHRDRDQELGRHRAPRAATGDDELGNSGARRMLVVLAQSPDGVTPSQLALRSGIARRGGTFRTYLGKLITMGWASRGGDRITATAEGARILGPVDPLPSGRDLLAYWLADLGQSGAARMLAELSNVYPRSLTKEQLGERTGIAIGGGTFRTYLGKLKTLELVEGRGEIRLSEELADG